MKKLVFQVSIPKYNKEEYITKGLPAVIAGDFYGDLGPAVFSYENELVGDYIDDIAITFQAFDFGDDYVLGDAIPTEIRYEMDQQGNTTKIGLPSQGTIRFNTSSYLYDYYDITSLTVHEIAHVLGFGTLRYNDYGVPNDVPAPWNQHGTGDIIDYYGDYVGEHALAAYSDYLGFTADYIPVEQSYGPGSAYVHWDEQYFEWDIMSYAQTGGPQELSTITIESLKDIGYEIVDFGDSNTQLTNYISTALSQENDLTNDMLMASINEDQNNQMQII